MRSRAIAFTALAVVCIVAAAAAAAIAVVGAGNERAASKRAVAAARPKATQVLASGKPIAVLRMLDRRHPETYGRMAIAPLDGTRPGAPILAGPSCARVAFGAGEGLCLDLLGTQMAVKVLDGRLNQVHELDLPGIPSRARISPDGRWGGVTAFIVGHAYAAPGQFSTAATIIDMRTGRKVADLEKDFTVTDRGKVVDARDRNYWGLTFAGDGDTFYATLAANGSTWLIKGSIRARTAHTIHENVECPSLSPDGTRIGYKKAVAHNPAQWRFTVLDLATGKETPLSETRSVDDQLAWLDDGHLLYGDGKRTWMVDADGTGRPEVWLNGTDSPTAGGAAT
jgi:hypothetical protein